jgi:PAS domain S-box-containing protein
VAGHDSTDTRSPRAGAPSAEERYRALFDHSRDAIYLHDLAGRFLDANAAALDLLGCSPDECRSLRLEDVLTGPGEVERAAAATQELVETGTQRTLSEYELRRRDGGRVWVEVQGSLVRKDGEPWAVQNVARDITARRRAEADLRSTTDLLESTFASLAEAVFVIDLGADRRILRCNAAAERIFGYRRDELVGQSARLLHVDEEAYQAFARLIQPQLGAVGEFRGDFRLKRRDGTIIDTEHVVTRLQDAGGTPGRAVSVVRDVTDRRRAEVNLRLQSAALQAAANAIVITNRRGIIEWVNPAFTRTTGYSADEAIGRNPGDLLRSGVHDRAFYRTLWDTILAGHVWQGEITNRRKDGSLVPEEMTITPVRDAGGHPAHFIAIKKDLTEVKRLQAEVLQAQKLETVGRLAGGIAHDFNNLLTIINATADLAAAGPETPDQLRHDLQQIREAGTRAADLTRQLLAFSRKQILQPVVMNLGGHVVGLRRMLQRIIGEDVDLVVSPPADQGIVRADPGQIEQVVLNLVVNARDAMPDGGRLTIETRDVELDGTYTATHGAMNLGPHVMLAVTDTGVGMDEPTRARIFEPFFTTKGPGKGTGLGLSTVYGIVSQSGGSVGVYSEPGRGTSFKIFLPRIDAEPRPTPDPAPKVAGGSETILLVEDEAAVRRLAERILSGAGYTVLTAIDGSKALEFLARDDVHVDLLITDVVLPGMNGRVLADRVGELYPEVKVLFTSGYTDDAILRHGVLDDGVAFLGKPYTAPALTGRVRKLLDG